MNMSHIEGFSDHGVSPASCKMQRESNAPRNSVRLARTSLSWSRVTPWLFLVGLWGSSLFALWMSRGSLALLLSGQLFSAGNWLCETFSAKREPLCFAGVKVPRSPGGRHNGQ